MAKLNAQRTREILQEFDFRRLFVDELGWSQAASPKPRSWNVKGQEYQGREIAHLGGVVVLELSAGDGAVPEARVRLSVHREVAKAYYEHVLLFVDRTRTQSVLSWARREGSKLAPRSHSYFKEQPGDLFLSKLSALVVDLADLAVQGDTAVAEVASRLREALDVERVTRRFYSEFQEQHELFLERIEGIESERDRRWYTSVLLNRLMFVYFLQKKSFLDGGDQRYLRRKLEASQKVGPDLYYRRFLKLLFFEGFARPAAERSPEARNLLGEICFLDGGLFLPHRIETDHPDLQIPDAAFASILDLFERYSWSLNDTPGGQDDEINPDVLGYIFEKYINQKEFGAYYTRPEITRYLCEKTIYALVLDRVNVGAGKGDRRFESIEELLLRLDARLCRKLFKEILPGLSILDPACGSGAFLVAALKTLLDVYSAVVGKIGFVNDRELREELKKANAEHHSIQYWVKKKIVTDNLFGVDIMEEATEIARLRLFLTLVASATNVEELEPLPNIDFNILSGNSLIGLLHVEDEDFERRQGGGGQSHLFRRTFRQVLREKNQLIEAYRHFTGKTDRLGEVRDEIDREKSEAIATLNDILLTEFKDIRFEQATWDRQKNEPGKPVRRPVSFKDVADLRPLHWGYEFDEVLGKQGGFDIILTNPPWEVFKPQAKEFFAEYSDIVKKNIMTIKAFEKEQARLMRNSEIRAAWLEYQSRFPHISLYYRRAPQYKNQIAKIRAPDGKEKKAGTDVNLYKLFLEQCFNLLRDRGRCGILLPTGIYTDLGAKQLREMLFNQARLGSLFGLSNEKFLFEGVDHRFRICLLNFQKGGSTTDFTIAFRIDPREAVSVARLESFLHNSDEHVEMAGATVRLLSPTSLSILELKSTLEADIACKMAAFPMLGDKFHDCWNLRLVREFDVSKKNQWLLHSSPSEDRLPLFKGEMFNQFELSGEGPDYWIDEDVGEARLRNRQFASYRWVHRRIARSSDVRTMISTIIPQRVFTDTNSTTLDSDLISKDEMLFLCAVTNSFVFDWLVRKRVDDTLSQFFLYQMPVPRLSGNDTRLTPFITRAARLVCYRPEFSDLWQVVMGSPWSEQDAATDPAERARLRAELDGLVAHLYGLTEEEFAYILTTFPVVAQEVKDAALTAYRTLAPMQGDPQILALIEQGESAELEFKSTARWDLREGKKNPDLEAVIRITVAGFLNAHGGTLLIGVGDDGSIVGLQPDYGTFRKPNRDGFELFLIELLLGSMGKDVATSIRTTFHEVDGKDVCRVTVAAGTRPVFLKEGNDEVFYLRAGNSTRRLTTREAVQYCKTRWQT
ncbi:MAG TPA: RNA-binding domain-containing protein [Thermoanaerobaculia bacterium]|nr:RNA-binding domain-containing protein [Thermoanaerobaculia bacterium]